MAADAYFLTEEDVIVLRQIVAERKAMSSNLRGRPYRPDPPPQAPDVYLARAPAGGLSPLDENTTGSAGTALNDDNPSSGEFNVYQSVDGTMEDAGFTIPAGYLGDVPLGGFKWVAIVRDKFGSWVALPVEAGSGGGGTSSGLYQVQVGDGSGGFYGDNNLVWNHQELQARSTLAHASDAAAAVNALAVIPADTGHQSPFAYLANWQSADVYYAAMFRSDSTGIDSQVYAGYSFSSTDAGCLYMIILGGLNIRMAYYDGTNVRGATFTDGSSTVDILNSVRALDVTGKANFQDVAGGLSVGGTNGVSLSAANASGLTTKRGLVTASTALPYTPANFTDWVGSDPTTVVAALDRIAAAMTTAGFSP